MTWDRWLASTLLSVVFGSSASAGELEPLGDRIELESNGSVSSLATYYADLSLTLSPLARYYETGPKFRITASETLYKYAPATGTALSKGRDTELDFLFGYGFAFDRWYLLAAVGPAITWSSQKPGDLSPSSTVVREGVKSVVSLYGTPTERTMFFGQGSYSTSSNSYYLQAKVGGAIAPPIFFGPEVALSGRMHFDQSHAGYDQWKVGGFVAGLHLGSVLFGLSSGFLHDRQQGNGGYGTVTARMTLTPWSAARVM